MEVVELMMHTKEDTKTTSRAFSFINGWENCEMHDISMVGRKYTRFKPNGKAMSHLDRALVMRIG